MQPPNTESKMCYVQHSRRASQSSDVDTEKLENINPESTYHEVKVPLSRKISKITTHELDRDRYYINPVYNLKKYQIPVIRDTVKKDDSQVFSDEELDDATAEFEEMAMEKRASWLQTQLDEIVKQIQIYYTLPSPGRIADRRDFSVYEGHAGVSYLYYHMFRRLYSQFKNEIKPATKTQSEHTLAELMQSHLQNAIGHIRFAEQLSTHRQHKLPTTFICGISGIFALKGVLMHYKAKFCSVTFGPQSAECAMEAARERQKSLTSLCELTADVLKEPSCELFYGAAGFLYSLLFVYFEMAREVHQLDTDLGSLEKPTIERAQTICSNVMRHDLSEALMKVKQCIDQVYDYIIQSGRRYVADHPDLEDETPIMFEWHGSQYLGVAHGLSGIVYVLSLAHWKSNQECNRKILLSATDFCIRQRYSSGNFKSSVGCEKDRLVQYCHGATSLSLLCCQIYKWTNEKKYLNAAIECAEIIWRRGLLRKGLGLCHGISGNAYPFMKLYGVTNDSSYLYRSWYFAWFSLAPSHSKQLQNQPDEPFSLFNGLGSAVCFFTDLCFLPYQHCVFPALDIF